MQQVDGFTLPDPTTWIVDVDRVNRVGENLIGLVHAALKLYHLHLDASGDERWDRRFFGHGQTPVLEPSREGQLVMLCKKIAVGRAGEEMFRYFSGQPGMLGYQMATYELTVALPWPKRQGQAAVETVAIDATRTALNRAGLVAWNALLALALGGPFGAHLPDDSLLEERALQVGPMTARNPQGGTAAWVIECIVQL